jgi:hypothetical protein
MKTPASARSSSICMNPPKAKNRLKSHKADRITAIVQSMVILHSNGRWPSPNRSSAAVQSIMYILSQGKLHDSSRLLTHLLKSAHSNLAVLLQFTVVGMYQKHYEVIFAAEFDFSCSM